MVQEEIIKLFPSQYQEEVRGLLDRWQVEGEPAFAGLLGIADRVYSRNHPKRKKIVELALQMPPDGFALSYVDLVSDKDYKEFMLKYASGEH